MTRTIPQIVGILNLTPDSFSGDGVGVEKADVTSRLNDLLDSGVHVVDVGAESTRPHATPLTATMEWQRLEGALPEIIRASHAAGVRVSVDTYHAETAARALDIGADIINDVAGLRDAAMLQTLARYDCDIVAMHSLTIPADPAQLLPEDADVIAVLCDAAKDVQARAYAAGIDRKRLIFDAGIGFGKSAKQSFEIIRCAGELTKTGLPLYIGHSRKSFLKLFGDAPAHDRDALTLVVSEYLLHHDIAYLRVHDVASHMALLKLHQAFYASQAGGDA